MISNSRSLLACALAVGVAAGHARAAEGGAPIYTVACQSSGVPLEITLDGALVGRTEGPDASALGAPLNLWLRAGKNALRVRSTAGAKIAADAAVHCKVLKNAPGDIVSTDDDSPGKPLAALDWTAARKKGPLDELLTVTLAEKDAPACALWKRAEKLTLDGPTRAAILKQVQELEAAFRARDAQRALALHRFVGEEWCRCFGHSLEEYRQRAPEQMRAVVEEAGKGSFQPWDPAQAKVELVADGRVAQVTVNGGAPIVIVQKEKSGTSTTRLRPFVAKVDGAFVIVR